jgi:hypothetical protein
MGIGRADKDSDQAMETIPEPMQDACHPRGDISIEKAKILVKSYFEDHNGEALDYGDLREALCIPLPIIVEACEQLEREGKIAGVD